MKLLIIEDEDVHFNTLKLRLKFTHIDDLDVHRASTLQSALKQLLDSPFDLIITDMHLPDSRNFDTFEILFKLYPQIPIIVMSAETDEEKGKAIIGIGAKDFVYKDIRYVDLLAEGVRKFNDELKEKREHDE